MSEALRVLFVHGLESNPQGTKARFLASHFDALTPAMNTQDFEGCIAQQAAAIATFAPDVVVGSSFGGAVATALLQRGVWRGPTVLLCPAAARMGLASTLPPATPITLVHGTRDDLIPLGDSEALLAGTDPAWVQWVTVDDGHRLQSLVDTGALADLVRDTHRRAVSRDG